MVRFCSLMLVLLFVGNSYGDIAAPKPKPKPKPPPPATKVLDDAPLEIFVQQKGETQTVLRISRNLFNQIKKAALNSEDDVAPGNAGGGLALGSTQTIVAGIALSLAIVTGGLWLIRRSPSSHFGRTATAAVVVAIFGAAGVAVWANAPPPEFFQRTPPPQGVPFRKEEKQRLTIHVVDNADAVQLYLPSEPKAAP